MDPSLNELRDTEDFFHFYQVPYDPNVVAISRLHILKRYNHYLLKENLLDGNIKDTDTWERQRSLLIKAYDDFVHSTPLEEKVFPVFSRG
ncbi:nitrogenase-stabilizing/protective protein NifW [Tepidibacillus marianensis]|uniref:nitrogenase-stabilizing/protective protein NifW n=1 Tax=Tepidibacillus marianensis TaxID=3131995 RepID=UPI0030D2A312